MAEDEMEIPKDANSEAAWRTWFKCLGAVADSDVVNATANLALIEREIFATAQLAPYQKALAELMDVLDTCRRKWDDIDNGQCAVCRIGYRYSKNGKLTICDWSECLSHDIRKALAAAKAVLTNGEEGKDEH